MNIRIDKNNLSKLLYIHHHPPTSVFSFAPPFALGGARRALQRYCPLRGVRMGRVQFEGRKRNRKRALQKSRPLRGVRKYARILLVKTQCFVKELRRSALARGCQLYWHPAGDSVGARDTAAVKRLSRHKSGDRIRRIYSTFS